MEVLGIEAVNIRNSGGLKHLIFFLEGCSNSNFFKKIIVFTNSHTKSKLTHINNITIISKRSFNLPYYLYIFYQFLFFKRDLKFFKCDLVFVPGSIFLNNFPNVLMPQNMLPFEKNELKRLKFSERLKLILVGYAQKYSLKKTDGIIFLSNYAFSNISKYSPLSKKTIIPHGINDLGTNFKINSEFDSKNPMRLLYVSPLYSYKHHEKVISAVNELIHEGLNIHYNIVGSGSKSAIISLKSKITNSNIHYVGGVSPNEISHYLSEADVFIFASTCENLPITLLEAMSHGLPIICSKFGVMPEILDNSSNFFFDPTNFESIKYVISKAYFDIDSLNLEAKRNLKLSKLYSWETNIYKTNKFLREVYDERI